jgi:hypothetical protein
VTKYFPVRRGAPVDPGMLGPRSRFGGAPWLPARGGLLALRPRTADRRACPLLFQLALDELPLPPALPEILVQVFVPGESRDAGPGAFVRVVDGQADEGELARVELGHDRVAAPILIGEPLVEPARAEQVSKLFGAPVTCAFPEDETAFGHCGECRAPRTLLFHLEAATVPEWSFGDSGWLVLAFCASHPWDVWCATFQVP